MTNLVPIGCGLIAAALIVSNVLLVNGVRFYSRKSKARRILVRMAIFEVLAIVIILGAIWLYFPT